MPRARMLMAVPPTIWSTLKRMASPASRAASTTPTAMPPTTPIQLLPVALPTIAPAKAPPSSMPSMAMLTTPDRSQSTPARAPRMSGVARRSVPLTSPTSEVVAPAVAHTSMAATNSDHGQRPAPSAPAWASAATQPARLTVRASRPSTRTVGPAGTAKSRMSSPRGLRTNVASPTAAPNSPMATSADERRRRRRAPGPGAGRSGRGPRRLAPRLTSSAAACPPPPPQVPHPALNCWRRCRAP